MRRVPLTAVAALAAVMGCAHAFRPDPAAYAQALSQGELDRAYQLTAPGYQARVPLTQFRAEYATPKAREARALAIRRALADQAAAAPELFDGAPDQAEIGAAREVLRAFVDAAEARRFGAVWQLLAAPLRARYTPERLEREFFQEPLAADRVRRAKEAAERPAERDGDSVRFPIAPGKAVVLTREADGYRIAAIE